MCIAEKVLYLINPRLINNLNNINNTKMGEYDYFTKAQEKELIKENMMVVSRNIKLLRIKNKMTQEYLAYKIGMEQQHVSQIETEPVNITIGTISKICRAFEIPLYEIFVQAPAV